MSQVKDAWHYNGVIWASWCLKSSSVRLQYSITGYIKTQHYCSLWGKSTCEVLYIIGIIYYVTEMEVMLCQYPRRLYNAVAHTNYVILSQKLHHNPFTNMLTVGTTNRIGWQIFEWNQRLELKDYVRVGHWICASCQIRKIVGCACTGDAGNVFPRRRFQRKPLVSDPGMHHGTCVTLVPWCMSRSLTCGDGENVPDIPGACVPAMLCIWQEAHTTSH